MLSYHDFGYGSYGHQIPNVSQRQCSIVDLQKVQQKSLGLVVNLHPEWLQHSKVASHGRYVAFRSSSKHKTI